MVLKLLTITQRKIRSLSFINFSSPLTFYHIISKGWIIFTTHVHLLELNKLEEIWSMGFGGCWTDVPSPGDASLWNFVCTKRTMKVLTWNNSCLLDGWWFNANYVFFSFFRFVTRRHTEKVWRPCPELKQKKSESPELTK